MPYPLPTHNIIIIIYNICTNKYNNILLAHNIILYNIYKYNIHILYAVVRDTRLCTIMLQYL